MSTWPEAFKSSVTVVIPKPHKDDYTQVKNFRPIALLECAGKLISKMIVARLQSDAVHFRLVHPLQFSGLKYRSTVDAGFFLTEYVTKARNAGRHTSALALDITQFFPSLKCDIIILMLEKLGFAPSLHRLFRSYYDGCSTRYLWNVFFSKDYNSDNGVPQGDPLSPIIAVLYLSLILKMLFPGTNGATICLSYIDDFVLLANNVLLRNNISQLEAAFSRLDDALASVGLHFKPNKMELMHFAHKDQSPHRGRKPIRFQSLFSSLPAIQLRSLQGCFSPVIITPSKEWRYLGFYFDPFLSFSSHVSRYANKALILAEIFELWGTATGA